MLLLFISSAMEDKRFLFVRRDRLLATELDGVPGDWGAGDEGAVELEEWTGDAIGEGQPHVGQYGEWDETSLLPRNI